jgi:hypothetical protein
VFEKEEASCLPTLSDLLRKSTRSMAAGLDRPGLPSPYIQWGPTFGGGLVAAAVFFVLTPEVAERVVALTLAGPPIQIDL